jgi:hypothetical protein
LDGVLHKSSLATEADVTESASCVQVAAAVVRLRTVRSVTPTLPSFAMPDTAAGIDDFFGEIGCRTFDLVQTNGPLIVPDDAPLDEANITTAAPSKRIPITSDTVYFGREYYTHQLVRVHGPALRGKLVFGKAENGNRIEIGSSDKVAPEHFSKVLLKGNKTISRKQVSRSTVSLDFTESQGCFEATLLRVFQGPPLFVSLRQYNRDGRRNCI